MSLTTDELNYLIWRYLQETGLEIPALALGDQSTVHQFDTLYKDHIPIGSLVNLVQKGILYSQADQLVKPNGDIMEDDEKFTLFHAVQDGINPDIQPHGRFEQLRNPGSNGDSLDDGNDNSEINNDETNDSKNFIKILKKKFSFEPSICSDWNPQMSSVLAYGLSDSRVKIVVILPHETKTLILTHPSIGDSNDITNVSWSPQGNLLISCVETGELRLWTADGKLKNIFHLHHSPIIILRWSPDSSKILSFDTQNVLIVWDVNTGGIIMQLDLTPSNNTIDKPNDADEILGVDALWINDLKFIIPGLSGNLLVYNIEDKTSQGTLVGHDKTITSIKYQQETSLLLTSSDDKTLRIWKGSNFNNSTILQGHSQPIIYADWITLDFVISCSLDSSIRVWDVKNSKQTGIKVLDGIPIIHAQLSKDLKLAVGTTEGIVSIFEIELIFDEQLKLIGEYQPMIQDDGFMTSLKWNDTDLVVTYSNNESVVLGV